MTEPSPTPVPDHGTGRGLLFLFVYLYGTVAVVGVGTVVAIVMHPFDREILREIRYLVTAGPLGLAGFTVDRLSFFPGAEREVDTTG